MLISLESCWHLCREYFWGGQENAVLNSLLPDVCFDLTLQISNFALGLLTGDFCLLSSQIIEFHLSSSLPLCIYAVLHPKYENYFFNSASQM